MNPATVDVGVIARGDAKSVEVVIRNTGDRTQTIIGANVSCYCLTSSDFPLSIEGGQEVIVAFGIMGTSMPGDPFVHKAILVSDCHRSAPLALTVNGVGGAPHNHDD